MNLNEKNNLSICFLHTSIFITGQDGTNSSINSFGGLSNLFTNFSDSMLTFLIVFYRLLAIRNNINRFNGTPNSLWTLLAIIQLMYSSVTHPGLYYNNKHCSGHSKLIMNLTSNKVRLLFVFYTHSASQQYNPFRGDSKHFTKLTDNNSTHLPILYSPRAL